MVTQIYQSKIWVFVPPQNMNAQYKHLNFQFRQLRELMANSSRTQQAENGIVNCDHSRSCILNVLNFGLQTTKIWPEIRLSNGCHAADCHGSVCNWRAELTSDQSRMLITVQRYALHVLSYRNSVCPSVRLSVTLVDCVHTVRPTIMISSPYGSPIILVSGDITFIPKFEGGHHEQGCWMRVGWVRIGDFRPISRRISETVRDTTKVSINHW